MKEIMFSILKITPITLIFLGLLYMGLNNFSVVAPRLLAVVIAVLVLIVGTIAAVFAWDWFCEGMDELKNRYDSWQYYKMMKRLQEEEDAKRNSREERSLP